MSNLPVLICHPRRAGKVNAVRHRIYSMLVVGDLVTLKAGKDAPKYRVIEKRYNRMQHAAEPLLIVENEKRPTVHDIPKTWEVDPATVRSVWESPAPVPAPVPATLCMYGAAGLTYCGKGTGGGISRASGYTGPRHHTTTSSDRVTCPDCLREMEEMKEMKEDSE